jgi:hypothetical protein
LKGRNVIEIDGLTKRYGDKTAVDRLSFVVEPGVVTGFLGPNGAGKSTTMRVIAGLDPMALLLGDMPGLKQVKFDAPGDDRDAGLAWFPGGEVAGFLGLAGAGPVGAVANVEAGHEDLEQERGEGLAELVRGGKPRPWRSRRPVHAGS